MNIYVSNLAYSATDYDIRQLFESYVVDTIRIITDRDTGQSRGFGFVEMPDSGAAKAAIHGLQGKELAGRSLTVDEAGRVHRAVSPAHPAGKSRVCETAPLRGGRCCGGGVSRQREARHSCTPPWICAVAQRNTRLSVSPPSHSPDAARRRGGG